MQTLIENVVECLNKHHGLMRDEAYSIVYAEWEFIENLAAEFSDESRLCDVIATQLIEIYMVA